MQLDINNIIYYSNKRIDYRQITTSFKLTINLLV